MDARYTICCSQKKNTFDQKEENTIRLFFFPQGKNERKKKGTEIPGLLSGVFLTCEILHGKRDWGNTHTTMRLNFYP